MRNVKIFSSGASNGAVALSDAIRKKGLKSTKVSFTSKEIALRPSDYLINWGSSKYPKWIERRKLMACSGILNMPEYVNIAIDKIATFKELLAVGVSIPEFTTEASDITEDWREIVCRAIVRGTGGQGITIVDSKNSVRYREASLYVRYIKKTKEYRVHVFNGTIIDVQEKRRSKEFEGKVDYKIRSHNRGWVFCREDVSAPIEVMTASIDAVDALNLDFGAVDVIWNRHHKRAYVLEVNTAPGLEGTTIDSYATAIISHINSLE